MNDLFPPHEAVAKAIVAACQETGGDPIKVASGQSDDRYPKGKFPVSRARAYAAFALSRAYPECARPAIAKAVGTSGSSRNSLFPSIEGGIARGTIKWFDQHVLARVVAVIEGRPLAHANREPPVDTTDIPEAGEEFFRNAKLVKPPGERMRALRDGAVVKTASTPPLKMGNLPMHDPRKLGKPSTEAPATRLKRVMGELGPPRRTAVEEGLERRASERKECRDILAEAARNTAALPIPKAPGDDE